MVIKRTEEIVEMPNGNRAHCYENHTTLDELKRRPTKPWMHTKKIHRSRINWQFYM